MKKITLLLLTFLIIIINAFSLKIFADSNKHALIIAVGNYDRAATGWSPISSENDIPLIKAALTGQGFDEENIAILQDKDADKAGITEAFNSLLVSVKKGDYVVVHYSGHGQQISDDNNDEIEGLDEALVSINAPSSYKAGKDYKGEEHFRDEEFGELIEELRAKVGKDGQVLVILDSCHSGTGTRGDAKVRGGEGPFIIPGQSEIKKEEKEEGSGMSGSSVKSRGNDDNLAPFVLFAGAKFDELNYETKDENGNGVGSLSFAVAKAFSEINTNSTYSSVFARVLEIMADVAPKQTPMIEGDINYKVFNGDVVEQEYYYEIEKVVDNTKIKINGGNVTGVSKGDKIGLYDIGTSSIDEETPVISGIVSETNNFNATVEFESDHNVKNLKSYWLFIEEYNLENSYMGIFVEDIDGDLNNLILSQLKDINSLTMVVDNKETADILVTAQEQKDKKNSRGSNAIYVKSMQTGSVIKEVKLDKSKDKVSKDIALTVKDYSQGMFIKNLELNDENYKVEIEFIPVVPESFDANGEPTADKYGNYIIKDTLNIEDFIVDGNIEFKETDIVMIKIINTGKLDAFFSIIDIQPDGIINPFYPTGSIKPQECFVESGKSYVPRDFIINGFGEPFGKEVIKVFANAKVIDLSPIITERGVGTRGVSNSLGSLMKSSYQTRGPKARTGSVSNKDTGSTIMYPFTINGN